VMNEIEKGKVRELQEQNGDWSQDQIIAALKSSGWSKPKAILNLMLEGCSSSNISISFLRIRKTKGRKELAKIER